MANDYQPTRHTAKTILRSARDVESALPIPITNDTRSTLNSYYNVGPDEVPSIGVIPKIITFGVGIGGRRNSDDGNLTEPVLPLADNMNLYTPIPIVVRPLENDLTPTEREQGGYCMRVPTTLSDGNPYVLYYLKKLIIPSTGVEFKRKNPITGNEEPYVLDYSKLQPTPPVGSINGVTAANLADINVSNLVTATISGSEIANSINIMYNGDMRYATISEIGLFSGTFKNLIGQDHTGTNFSYEETIMTQLNVHTTWNGSDMSDPLSTKSITYRVGKADVVVVDGI